MKRINVLLSSFLLFLSVSCALSPARMILQPEQRSWTVSGHIITDQKYQNKKERMPGYAFSYQSGVVQDVNAGLTFSLWPFGETIIYLSPFISYQSLGSDPGWALRHSLSYDFIFDKPWKKGWVRGPKYMHTLTLTTLGVYSGTDLQIYMPLDISLIYMSTDLFFRVTPGMGLMTRGEWSVATEYSYGFMQEVGKRDWEKLSLLRLGLTRIYIK